MKTSITTRAFTVLLMITMLLTNACAQAQTTKHEFRKVSDFSGVKAGGGFIITVVKGKTNAVKVEAEPQMLARIKTEVKDGILNIYTDGKTETDSPMRIYLTMAEFKKAEISGASRLKSDGEFISDVISLTASGAGSIEMNVKAGEVNIDASGAGRIDVKGSAERLIASLTGASSLDAYELQTNFASVKTTDAANAKLTANETLNVQANGASYINYKGTPGKERINTTGTSFVEKKGA